MVRIVELIERDYDEAREAGRLSESGAMPLLDSEDLVVISRESLERMVARLEEAERELDKRLFEESLAWFRAQGYTDDKLLSPEDLVDDMEEAPSAYGGARKPSGKGRNKVPRTSFLDVFGSLFAKRAKQVG
ncbi:hypothetical protein BSCH_02036 [Candidatus Paraburkholderia schumanniana]|nr:hypothetical protein BSCH_02036 [Candidatus Paraburkholderia schumannianae]